MLACSEVVYGTLALILIHHAQPLSGIRDSSTDAYNVPELILSDGYPLEIHSVTTEDGYILQLHRIPNKSTKGGAHKPVVLFAHCLSCSSAAFLVLDSKRSLAYRLANLGYDVWLMNSRGTKYSRNHLYVSPESWKFWTFSWHEQGLYDLPASIDYVLKRTLQQQLDFIGFSMGNTQFFVLMSERPEYNQKIRTMIALAPAVFLKGSRFMFPSKFRFSQVLMKYGAKTGNMEFPSPDIDINAIYSGVCNPDLGLKRSFCSYILRLAGGSMENGHVDQRSLPVYLRFFPEATSIMSMVHYDQITASGLFQKYDFGTKRNLLKYGTVKPPSYNLSLVTAPVNIFSAEEDELAPMKGSEMLRNKLPNAEFFYRVPDRDFAHVDFIWGSNANVLVYDVVLQRLKLARQGHTTRKNSSKYRIIKNTGHIVLINNPGNADRLGKISIESSPTWSMRLFRTLANAVLNVQQFHT